MICRLMTRGKHWLTEEHVYLYQREPKIMSIRRACRLCGYFEDME